MPRWKTTRRNSHHGSPGGTDCKTTGTPDARPIPHLNGTQNLGSGADDHVVADGGVALSLVLPGAAQGYSLVNGYIIANFGSLSHDHAHPVVDKESRSDLGPGMDLDPRQETGKIGYHAGQ